MKKFLLIAISLFFFSVQAEILAQVVDLHYDDYQGKPVYLVINFDEGTASLKTAINFWEDGSEELLFLKEKVVQIFSSSEIFKAGDYTFRCSGFYPEYEPKKKLEGADINQYLTFSKEVEDIDNIIHLRGHHDYSTNDPYIPNIPVGGDNFKKLFEFIQKEGGKYSFIDSQGNLHVFVLIYQDEEAYQITVYGYYKGIRSQTNYFPYIVYRERIYFGEGDFYPLRNIQPIKLGYEEFVNFVIT